MPKASYINLQDSPYKSPNYDKLVETLFSKQMGKEVTAELSLFMFIKWSLQKVSRVFTITSLCNLTRKRSSSKVIKTS